MTNCYSNMKQRRRAYARSVPGKNPGKTFVQRQIRTRKSFKTHEKRDGHIGAPGFLMPFSVITVHSTHAWQAGRFSRSPGLPSA
jgi:hypothetical protein